MSHTRRWRGGGDDFGVLGVLGALVALAALWIGGACIVMLGVGWGDNGGGDVGRTRVHCELSVGIGDEDEDRVSAENM